MDGGDHFRIEVKAAMFGQSIINVFDYLNVSGIVDTLTVLTAFRAIWRADYLDLITDAYQVNSYEIKRLAGIYPERNSALYPTGPRIPGIGDPPVPRWDESNVLAGVTATDAGSSADPMLSTAAAVSFRKSTVAWEAPDNITTLPLEKKPRGSFRLAGFLVSDTEPLDGNSWTAAAVAEHEAIADALRTFTYAGGDAQMIVVSFQKDGFYRANLIEPGGGAPDFYEYTYAVAAVTSLIASPFVSSQVSRKQTVGGLG